MSDFEANKQKYFDWFYKYTRQDVCKLKNKPSNLKQDKQKLCILKTNLSDYKKSALFLINN